MELHEYKRSLIPTQGNTGLANRLWNSDVGTVKRKIKQKLIENQDIRDLINNADLKDTDDYSNYLYQNIFPFLVIPDTIYESKAYICFKVDDADTNYYNGVRKDNPLMKVVEIEFMVVVHKDVVETNYGIDRHDALAYVLKQMFSHSENLFGFRLRCVSDIEGVTDNNFITRTLTFEVEEPSNLTDTRRKNPYGN